MPFIRKQNLRAALELAIEEQTRRERDNNMGTDWHPTPQLHGWMEVRDALARGEPVLITE